jgi:hypothetical protein
MSDPRNNTLEMFPEVFTNAVRGEEVGLFVKEKPRLVNAANNLCFLPSIS